MDTQEHQLTEAAASLTVEDFRYLQQHGMIPARQSGGGPAGGADTEYSPDTRVKSTECSTDTQPAKKRKRHHIRHEWPDVGQILAADYDGVCYEAEVIKAPQYKSGRALRILSGPAAGKVSLSMSGAMLMATQAQRKEQGLGRRGVGNGWGFWKLKEEGNADGQNS